jgi:hypothetical protein
MKNHEFSIRLGRWLSLIVIKDNYLDVQPQETEKNETRGLTQFWPVWARRKGRRMLEHPTARPRSANKTEARCRSAVLMQAQNRATSASWQGDSPAHTKECGITRNREHNYVEH